MIQPGAGAAQNFQQNLPGEELDAPRVNPILGTSRVKKFPES
jgi:hypothetical protein